MRLLTGIFCAVLMGMGLVQAQAQTQAVNPQLAPVLEKTLDALLAPDSPTDKNTTYIWQGRTQVLPAQNRYAIRLPSLTMVLSDGGKLEVGVVRIDLVPQNEGGFGLEFILPSRMTVFAKDGTRDGTLTVGTQTFKGSWKPGENATLVLNGNFGAVKSASSLGIKLAQKAGFQAQFAGNKSGVWNGNLSFSVGGYSFIDSQNVPRMSVGQGAMNLRLDSIDLANFLKRSREQAAEEKKKSSSLTLLQGIVSGLHLDVTAQNVTRKDVEKNQSLQVKEGAVSFNISNLSGEKADAALKFHHTGYQVQSEATSSELTPRDLDFNIVATGLPNAGLWNALVSYIDNVAKFNQTQADAMFKEEALARLNEAGSAVRIDSFRVNMPSASGYLSGLLTFDRTAKRGFVGDVSLVCRDLAETAAAVDRSSGRIPDIDTIALLMMLRKMQNMGQSGTDNEGHTLHAYQVKFATDGVVTINDEDMTSHFDKVWGTK